MLFVSKSRLENRFGRPPLEVVSPIQHDKKQQMPPYGGTCHFELLIRLELTDADAPVGLYLQSSQTLL